MKSLICLSIFLLIGMSCIAQEVEVCSSVNTSSEQRFQNALGIGFQYQHDISKKFRVGFGVHYNINKAQFINKPFIAAMQSPTSLEKIASESKRFSIRLNIQGLLRDNESLSVSLGPELSYNYLWGKDKIDIFYGEVPGWGNFTQNNGLAKEIGIGFISKIEIKDFMTKQLSLCFTIRPELLIGKGTEWDGVGTPVFSESFSFTEFQMGLKYRFKANSKAN